MMWYLQRALWVLPVLILWGCDEPKSPPSDPVSSCNSIGLLSVESYFFPSQPGDPDDHRTWCMVENECSSYTCVGVGTRPDNMTQTYHLRKSMVANLTWSKVQHGTINPTIEASFKTALGRLMRDPNVCSIVGAAGFFYHYQDLAAKLQENISAEDPRAKKKPMLLSTLNLLDSRSPWGASDVPSVSKRRLVITSNYPDLHLNASLTLQGMVQDLGLSLHGPTASGQNLRQVLEDGGLGIRVLPYEGAALDTLYFLHALSKHLDPLAFAQVASTTLIIGWNTLVGYGLPVVYSAGFHNSYNQFYGQDGQPSFLVQLQRSFQNATAMGISIQSMVLESTEMPAMSNSLRQAKERPVVDVAVLARCAGEAEATLMQDCRHCDVTTATLKNQRFRQCIEGWYTSSRYDPLFGLQKETGKLKWYEDQNFTTEDLKSLFCTGGRPRGHQCSIGRKMEDIHTEIPGFSVPQVCMNTTFTCYCGGCKEPCPGGGSCLETAPCGLLGGKNNTPECTRFSTLSFEEWENSTTQWNISSCPGCKQDSDIIPNHISKVAAA